MNYKVLYIAMMVLLLSNFANSASIYKCTKKDKTVIFTDGKCPANTEMTLIHKETEQEIKRKDLDKKILTIKRLITNNQADAAKEYAIKNNLSEVYREQLALYLKQKAEEEKQNAERDKQQQAMMQQQALTLQQQQLELQKQQIAIDKAQAEQQLMNNTQPYYIYPFLTQPFKTVCQSPNDPKHCVPPPSTPNPIHAPLSSGGLNPPQSFFPQMNPPQK